MRSDFNPTPPPKVLKVWSNGVDTVAAYSPEDVKACLKEVYGYEDVDLEEEEYVEVPPDRLIRVHFEELTPYPVTLEDVPEGASFLVVATARQWAEKKGRGIICTTER